ncbi:MAG: response regulator [Pirellulales bacterium]
MLDEKNGVPCLRISVRDTGIGIPPTRLTKLFSPFTQVDASTTRKYGGTGLGLAICRQLIELMGGVIGVDSQEGKGSTFWCELPLKVVAGPNIPAVSTTDALRDLRVYAVDDTATNLEILEHQLSRWGMRVSTQRDPEVALDELLRYSDAGTPYDLMIVDYHMPCLNGMDLASMIHRHPRLSTMPIMMLTSVDQLVERRDCERYGLKSILTKPIRESRLFDSLISTLHDAQSEGTSPTSLNADKGATVPTADLGSARILIAEDNEINQIVTGEILAGAGYAYDLVENGREALLELEKRTYDLILMDCQMPELDGFATTREIRAEKAEANYR